MAVQQNKTSRSKRNMRRAHDHAVNPTLSVDQLSGERHHRHCMTKDGYYRGKLINLVRASKQVQSVVGVEKLDISE